MKEFFIFGMLNVPADCWTLTSLSICLLEPAVLDGNLVQSC